MVSFRISRRLELIAYRWWHGPLRRPFRAIAWRLIKRSSRIVCGPLRGQRFTGQELVCRVGIYELHVQYALKQLLAPGDVFYDVGANNGYLSLLGSQCAGRGGLVYAFEPMPRNSQRIKKLMAENRVENCQLIELAVSNRPGETELYLGHEEDAYTPSLIRDRRSLAMTVGVTTLDQFALEHRRPDLIKLDVEGAEVMVIEGARQLLSSVAAPKWLIEAHSSDADQEVRKILLEHGYRIEALPSPAMRKPYPTHFIASKPAPERSASPKSAS